jgi:hypothetical protein
MPTCFVQIHTPFCLTWTPSLPNRIKWERCAIRSIESFDIHIQHPIGSGISMSLVEEKYYSIHPRLTECIEIVESKQRVPAMRPLKTCCVDGLNFVIRLIMR